MQHSHPCPHRKWMPSSWQVRQDIPQSGALPGKMVGMAVKLAIRLPLKTVRPLGFARGQILYVWGGAQQQLNGGLSPLSLNPWLQTVSFEKHSYASQLTYFCKHHTLPFIFKLQNVWIFSSEVQTWLLLDLFLLTAAQGTTLLHETHNLELLKGNVIFFACQKFVRCCGWST